jgi:hypothetical protein
MSELDFLLETWQRFAKNYVHSEGYIYEWLNFMDTRRLLGNHLLENNKSLEAKITKLDRMVLKSTFEVNECIWGPIVEKEKFYNRTDHWYYFRLNILVFENENSHRCNTFSKK